MEQASAANRPFIHSFIHSPMSHQEKPLLCLKNHYLTVSINASITESVLESPMSLWMESVHDVHSLKYCFSIDRYRFPHEFTLIPLIPPIPHFLRSLRAEIGSSLYDIPYNCSLNFQSLHSFHEGVEHYETERRCRECRCRCQNMVK
jgi:hypothetical protein